MQQTETLNLSIGDVIPDRRLSTSAHVGDISLQGKQVRISLSADALRATANSHLPILAELELYFSCLVRKQLHFRAVHGVDPGYADYAQVIPGFYTRFRAVTTRHCCISEAGEKPPPEPMPVKNLQQFVPNWIRIDYRAGRWLGEYGFSHD